MNKEALSENYFQRANVRVSLGKYEKAIADFDVALRLNPQNATAYNNRGAAKFHLGQHQEALADFDEALHLNPQDGEVYYNRGNAKSNLEQYEDARADLQHALELAMKQGNERAREAAQKLLNALPSSNSPEGENDNV